jgi:putative endonuclease
MSNPAYAYAYILQSESCPSRFYTGYTSDLEARLKEHNKGHMPSTKPYRPWRIKTAIAFTDEARARDFQRYLKTQSGRAFAKKHL